MNFGERLRHARKVIAKISQKELEARSGVRQQIISRLESGEQDETPQVVQLAVACGVRPEWLAMADGDPVERAPLPPLGTADAQVLGHTTAPGPTEPAVRQITPLVAAAMRVDSAPHVPQSSRDALVTLMNALINSR